MIRSLNLVESCMSMLKQDITGAGSAREAGFFNSHVCIGVKGGRFNSQQLANDHFWSLTEEVQDPTTYNDWHHSRGCSHTLVPHLEPLERCGPISVGIALIHHPVDNVLKALKGHFKYPVKLHGIAIQTKFATHVRWSVLPSPGFSPAVVLVDEHGEEGNDVFSLIVRNLSIDDCLFNKWLLYKEWDDYSRCRYGPKDMKTHNDDATLQTMVC